MSFFINEQQNEGTASVDNFLATPAALRRFNRDYDPNVMGNAPIPKTFQFVPTEADSRMYYDVGTPFRPSLFQSQTALGQIWLQNNQGQPPRRFASNN